ncbi:flagellar protein FliS [Salipaludibacillus neizhouensis]|uniref:Flagellar protein FliS n=1 Tax=Salipaludibacillus neizhouensis TaxID=885475 RepID=A0A3A9KKP7_9BACI|nr:flagellar protein FliS [Salipaludibacillus neizhouensis]
MAVNNPYAKYKQSSVETKSAGELTLMLYDGCLKFIKRAEKALNEKNMEEKNTNLMKAQNIIRELMVTLNTDVNVSQNMMQMYDFIMSKLIEANTGNDLEALSQAEQFVLDFRDTWKEVIKKDRQNRHGGGTASTSTEPKIKTKPAENKVTPITKQEEAPAPTPTPNRKPAPNNPYAAAKRAATAAAGSAGTSYRK